MQSIDNLVIDQILTFLRTVMCMCDRYANDIIKPLICLHIRCNTHKQTRKKRTERTTHNVNFMLIYVMFDK